MQNNIWHGSYWTWYKTYTGLIVTKLVCPKSRMDLTCGRTVGPTFLHAFWWWTNRWSTLGYITRTKSFWDPVSLGLNMRVELSLGPKVGGLNIKAPIQIGTEPQYYLAISMGSYILFYTQLYCFSLQLFATEILGIRLETGLSRKFPWKLATGDGEYTLCKCTG